MIKTYPLVLCLAIGLLTFSSCEKLIEIKPPSNELPSELIFSSDNTARAALSGAFSQLSSSQPYSWLLTGATAMSSDEILYNNAGGRYDYFLQNTYDPINASLLSDLWGGHYTSIYRFNSVIRGLEGNTSITASLSQQLIAEAKFMRALLHFNLLQLFNEVPLITSTNVSETALTPRNTREQVYAQIIKDLEEAKANLATSYVGNTRLEPNKGAAAALLARVYLYTRNYANASSNASEVINQSSLYTLAGGNALSGIFLKNSSESILQLGSAGTDVTGYTGEGAAFVSTPTSQTFTLTPALLQAFETGDLRRAAWVREKTTAGVTYYEPYKYQNNDRTTATASGRQEAPTLIRLAEMYLIRAEAKASQQDTNGALADLNVIRNRAGLPWRTGGSANEVLSWIWQEKRIEFFCEQGHRWFDLNRTNRINAVMQAAKPQTWQSFARWYPIPQTVRDANPNLTQNEGYR